MVAGVVSKQRWNEANAELGYGVERYVDERMIDEGIAETIEYIVSEVLQIFIGVVEGRNDFVVDQIVNEGADPWMLDGLANRFEAEHVANGHHGGVGAVEDAHFGLAVTLDVIYDFDVQVGLVDREFCLQRLRGFDNPTVVLLAFDQELIVEADVF